MGSNSLTPAAWSLARDAAGAHIKPHPLRHASHLTTTARMWHEYPLPDATNTEADYARANNLDLADMGALDLMDERTRLVLAEQTEAEIPHRGPIPLVPLGMSAMSAPRWVRRRIEAIDERLARHVA